MMWEIAIIGVLMIIVTYSRGLIDGNKFIKDNEKVFKLLKEDDYDFYVAARYGDGMDVDKLYETRVKNGLLVLVILVVIFIQNLNFINLLACFGVSFLIFKSGYTDLKKYYKKHLHEIDLLLPYYLKSLEILIQHYTVPVALGKSLETAPIIFKEGLRELVEKINAGDSSIDPYMEFAIKYPVRDSMRMMRLLYRLGLGKQERKQEQLLMFSRTVSTLQAKSRDTKYKERLDRMEKRTMVMLSSTGIGVMIILLLSIVQIFTHA